MLDASEGKNPAKKGGRKAGASAQDGGMRMPTNGLPLVGPLPPMLPEAPMPPSVGGVQRPWMVHGESLRARTLVEDAGVVLWEGGEKTTVEIKRDILDLLEQVDSLVAVVDLKRAERPDEPRWWPSLEVVRAWVEEDPFFGAAIDRWRHARQERLLETMIWDLNAGKELSKAQLEILKLRLKFTSTVLPRTVNKGLREKVDIETTNSHHHFFESLSDEALLEKMAALRRNPKVRELLVVPDTEDGLVLDGQVLPPALPAPVEPLPFQDPGALGDELMGRGDAGGTP